MATAKQKQLEQKLLKLAEEMREDDSVSVQEFAEFVKVVVEFMQKIKAENAEERQLLKAETDALRKRAEALSKELSKLSASFKASSSAESKRVGSAIADFEKRLSKFKDGYTPQKGIDFFDGDNADPEEAARLALEHIGPQLEKLEEMSDEIEGLREDLKNVSKDRRAPIIGFGGTTGRNLIREVDISGQLDGSTKTFNIGAFYRILSVDLSSFPYALRKSTDYTYNGSAGTITFTDEIDAASTLAAGQTAIITLVVA